MIKTHPTNHLEGKKSMSDTLHFLTYLSNCLFQALVHDNYRCLVTGAIDLESWRKIEELQEELREGPWKPIGVPVDLT